MFEFSKMCTFQWTLLSHLGMYLKIIFVNFMRGLWYRVTYFSGAKSSYKVKHLQMWSGTLGMLERHKTPQIYLGFVGYQQRYHTFQWMVMSYVVAQSWTLLLWWSLQWVPYTCTSTCCQPGQVVRIGRNIWHYLRNMFLFHMHGL